MLIGAAAARESTVCQALVSSLMFASQHGAEGAGEPGGAVAMQASSCNAAAAGDHAPVVLMSREVTVALLLPAESGPSSCTCMNAKDSTGLGKPNLNSARTRETHPAPPGPSEFRRFSAREVERFASQLRCLGSFSQWSRSVRG